MIMQFTSRSGCKYTQFILPVTFKTSLFTDTVRGNKCLDTFVANCSFETFAIKWVFAALWFSFGPLLLANFLQFSSYEGLFDRLVISKSSFNKVRRLVQSLDHASTSFLFQKAVLSQVVWMSGIVVLLKCPYSPPDTVFWQMIFNSSLICTSTSHCSCSLQ